MTKNITVARVREVLGADVAQALERMARTVYDFGEKVSRKQGIIIADTNSSSAATRRRHHPDRRGDDPRQFAVLGGRRLQTRPAAAELRQATAARLTRQRARAGRWNGDAPPRRCRPAWWTPPASAILEAFRRVTGSELAV